MTLYLTHPLIYSHDTLSLRLTIYIVLSLYTITSLSLQYPLSTLFLSLPPSLYTLYCPLSTLYISLLHYSFFLSLHCFLSIQIDSSNRPCFELIYNKFNCLTNASEMANVLQEYGGQDSNFTDMTKPTALYGLNGVTP